MLPLPVLLRATNRPIKLLPIRLYIEALQNQSFRETVRGMLVVVLLCLLAIDGRAVLADNSTITGVIQTSYGPLRGLVQETVWHRVKYSSFKGIPFARPPLGPLRFKAPLEPEPWTEVRDAFVEGSDCPQYNDAISSGDEDCLYLNVYTPELKFNEGMELRAVMVWVFAGAFMGGTSRQSTYGPDFFIEDNVIVVCMNYRLGALGFLALHNENVPGNAGLKDQLLSLKWVQKNIANFGGDPKRVTFFGESAGGVSVDAHRLSPLSKGLFQQTIAMSSSMLAPWSYSTPRQGLRRAFKFGKFLGLDTNNVDELYQFLMNASAELMAKTTPKETGIDAFWKPVIEEPGPGAFLSECPIKLIQSGSFNDVPHIMSFTKEESILFLPPSEDYSNAKVLETYLMNILDYLPESKLLSKLLEYTIKMLHGATVDVIVWVTSSLYFIAPIDLSQRLFVAKSKQPIYYYRLSLDSEYAFHKVVAHRYIDGAAHGDDVGYLFVADRQNFSSNPDDPMNLFRKRLVRLFTNFANYGNPTPDGEKDELLEVDWKKTDLRHGWQLDVNEQLTIRPRMIGQLARALEPLYHAALPMEGCNPRTRHKWGRN